jgi:hypothetical protein
MRIVLEFTGMTFVIPVLIHLRDSHSTLATGFGVLSIKEHPDNLSAPRESLQNK